MENRLIGSGERIRARREGSIFQEALQEAQTPVGGQRRLRRPRHRAEESPSQPAERHCRCHLLEVSTGHRLPQKRRPSPPTPARMTAKREGNQYLPWLRAEPGPPRSFTYRRVSPTRCAKPFARREGDCYCMVKKCQRNGPFGLINGIY